MATHNNKSIDPYLNQDRYDRVLDRYEFVKENIQIKYDGKHNATFLDIGCGDAALLYQISKIFPKLDCSGLDYSAELLSKCKENALLKDLEFHQGDASKFDLGRQFDFALSSGVLSIFNSIEEPLTCMLNHLKKDGIGFVFTPSNHRNIDVLLQYKNKSVNSEEWETGLNMFSLDTITSGLEKLGAREIETISFNIKVDIDESDNPVNSYTVNTDNGDKMIVNGMNLILDFYLIVFKKS